MSPPALRRAARASALAHATRRPRLASTFVPCGGGFAPDATAARAFASLRARPGGRVGDCARTSALAHATRRPRLASTFVPCGGGFAPDATAARAFASLRARPGGRVGDCAKTVVLADAGHGVGRALLASLLAYPDCRLTVAAATPSAELTAALRNQHWQACEALQSTLARVDLGDDAEVARWRESVLFTHGTPDVVVANVGCMPTRWLRAYGDAAAANGDDSDRFATWRAPPEDWSRMMNDVKGVANVARQFLPAMVEAAREEAEASLSRGAENENAEDEKDARRTDPPRRAFVVVSHVVDPPAGATLAPYEASRAALAAVTRTLAADLRNVASELNERRTRAGKRADAKRNARNEWNTPYPYGGSGGVVAALVDPGPIPGLATERDGADVGPLHTARGDERAADWARAAVPFMLRMTHEAAGETIHVPGFK